MLTNIKINCHSSISLNEEVYIDPFNINVKKSNAKVIFITHPHFDHLDINSIQNIINNDTKIVCTEDSAEQLQKEGIQNEIIVVAPFESGEVAGIRYKTFPAYNVGHHHFKKYGFVGYRLKINGVSFTICGDSDLTDELKEIKTDILFVPIGGKYTMNSDEAAQLTNTIRPKVVIPVHYGYLNDTAPLSEGKVFASKVDEGIQVITILK